MTRRDILRQSAVQAGAVWSLLAQQQHSHTDDSAPSGGLKFFSAEQAKEVDAMSAQIIPLDETGGAREAGVIRFIDLNLATFDTDKQAAYADGLKMLADKSGGRFSDLASAKQIEVLRSIEKTDFFDLVRTHTVMGFFSNPKYGGNRDKMGWKLIGFEDAFVFQPPFGYYDGPDSKNDGKKQ